ncbi:stage V sporulation protein E [soil metagenome]
MLLLVVVVVLNLIGVLMVLSASTVTALDEHGSSVSYFKREVLWVTLGAAVLVAALRIDYHRWQRLARPLLAGSLGLLVLVLVPGVGVNINGSTRWLGAGPLQVQPSELAKLAIVLFVAALLARREEWLHDTRRTLRPVMTVLVVTALLIMLQPNLGTTIVVAVIVFTMLFSAGVPLGPLAGWGATGVLAATAAALGEGYRRARVLAFLDPWADPLNTGYQTIQSQVSLASGGLLGVGVGASRANWGFLPFAHTDFIFAIIGEELGLLGAVTVVALYGAIGFLGVRTAIRAPDALGRMLAIGITTWLCVQAFVNIGAVIGILPVTGVPLPFLSFGGSSMLATMAGVGVLLNVSRHT